MPVIGGFLNQYQAALNAADGVLVATFHAGRFMQMGRSADGWQSSWRRNDSLFAASIARACAFYRRLGAARFHIASLRAGKPQPSHAVARATWRIERVDGAELVELETTYLLRVKDGSARIVALFDHDEEGRLRERGLLTDGASDLLFRLPLGEALGASTRRRAVDSGRISVDTLFEVLNRTG